MLFVTVKWGNNLFVARSNCQKNCHSVLNRKERNKARTKMSSRAVDMIFGSEEVCTQALSCYSSLHSGEISLFSRISAKFLDNHL